MAVRGSEYVQAAKCLGFSDRVTLFRHVLPNAFGPVVAYAVSDAVLVMLAGCVPFLSFWVERRVARQVESELAAARQ